MSEPIKVLLVEDEQTLAMIVKDTLDEEEFEVTVATNGEEGLHLAHELKPHVIVADIMMPEMDGFEMVRRIRRKDPFTPVIFLTARSAVEDVVEGVELGGNDYLRKPFSMRELIARIRVLERSKERQDPQQRRDVLQIGLFTLDTTTQMLAYYGQTAEELSNRESEVLRLLADHRNKVVESPTSCCNCGATTLPIMVEACRFSSPS